MLTVQPASGQGPVSVVSVMPFLVGSGGGPTFSVSALSEACAREGARVSIVAPHYSTEPPRVPNPDLVPAVLVKPTRIWPLPASLGFGFAEALRQHVLESGAQIIHSHGLWTAANYAAVEVALKLRLPLMIGAHGMLQPWAWRYHAWKKRPAWLLWQRRHLRASTVLRAASHSEADSFRARGLRNPIAMVPHGIDLPPEYEPRPRAAQGIRTAFFLSRIHPVKGLVNLVQAWKTIRPSGWQMVICGPDEANHTAEVRSAVGQADLNAVFLFRPPAYDSEKEEMFARSDLFILPSLSENFSMSVAEALGRGIPVITTKATPWSELEEKGAGWWVDTGVEPLAAALRQATSMPEDALKGMGKRGRELIAAKYSWPPLARGMIEVYEWMLGRRPPPAALLLA